MIFMMDNIFMLHDMLDSIMIKTLYCLAKFGQEITLCKG
jgi:hypothetical protein